MQIKRQGKQLDLPHQKYMYVYVYNEIEKWN